MNQKPRLLFISPYYLPIMGGIEQNIYKVTSYLKRDYEIHVAVVKKANPSAKDNTEGIIVKKLTNPGFWKLDYENYEAIVLTNFSILPHFVVMLRLLWLHLFRRIRPEVILIPHGGATLDWSQFPVAQRIIKQAYNLIGFTLARSTVTRTIAVSDWEKEELAKKRISKEIRVVRNGVDLDPPVTKSKGDYLIFVGRIHVIKNVEGVIELFGRLTQTEGYTGYKLIIVGPHKKNLAYYEKLKKLTMELQLDRAIVFVGEKTGDEKLRLISEAQALLCLSHWENDPIVIKEAFSVGTKVIINSKYGLADFKEEPNAFVYEGQANLEPLRQFLTSPFVKVFKHPLQSWEDVAKAYEKTII